MKKVIILVLLYAFCLSAKKSQQSPLEESWQELAQSLSSVSLEKALFEQLETLKVTTDKNWSRLEQEPQSSISRFINAALKYISDQSTKNKNSLEKLAEKQYELRTSFIDEETLEQFVSLVGLLKRKLNVSHSKVTEQIRREAITEQGILRRRNKEGKKRERARHKRSLTKIRDQVDIPGFYDILQDDYIKAKNAEYLKTKSLIDLIDERCKKKEITVKKRLHKQMLKQLVDYNKINEALNKIQNTLLLLMVES